MGADISQIITDSSLVALGEATAIDKAKQYYLLLGDNAHEIVKTGLEQEQNKDIKDKLEGLGIKWPEHEDMVLDSVKGFFYDTNQLNWQQAVEWLNCLKEAAGRVKASGK